jgi:hypothetical protein
MSKDSKVQSFRLRKSVEVRLRRAMTNLPEKIVLARKKTARQLRHQWPP